MCFDFLWRRLAALPDTSLGGRSHTILMVKFGPDRDARGGATGSLFTEGAILRLDDLGPFQPEHLLPYGGAFEESLDCSFQLSYTPAHILDLAALTR